MGTQQKLGLNLEIKFCTQAASLEMSFGLLISWGSLKQLFRQNLILSTLLSAGECVCVFVSLPLFYLKNGLGLKLSKVSYQMGFV